MADNKIIINAELDAKFDSLKELRKEIFSLAKLMKASGTEDTVYDKVAATARKAQSEIANISKALKNVGSGEDIERLNKKVEQLTATFRRFYAEATRAIGISDRTVTSVEARLANKGAVPAIPQRTLGSIGNVGDDEEYEKYKAGLAAYRRSADKDATAEEVAILKERQRLTKTTLKANEDSWKEHYSKLAAEQEAAQKEDLARNKDYHKTLVNLNNQNLKNVRAQELATIKDYYSKIHAVTKTGEEEQNRIIARIRKQQTKPVPTEKIVPETPKVKERTIFNAQGFIQQSAAKIQESSLKVRILQKELDRLKATFHSFSAADTKRNFLQKMGIEDIPKTKKGLNNLGSALKNSVTVELKAAELAANGTRTGLGRMLNTIRTSVVDLAKFQARWYATRWVIFAPFQLSGAMLREAFDFAKTLDMWEAKLLRWEATSGKVSSNFKADMQEIIKSARALALQYPVAVDEILKTTEEFVSAGMPSDVIKKLIPDFTKIKVAFPEINMAQFAPAITGAWNSWKETIGETADEAEKFRIILAKLLYAQARGVIKPENFSVMLQHLSEMARVSGLDIDQMLALSVAVTDLGSKTGSATRSLRQFLQQLQSAKNLKVVSEWLKTVGVDVDIKKPLGGQLFDIIKGFQKLIGTGGPRSMEAMSWLRKIFPLETLKTASTTIDFLEKITKLVAELKDSGGGLDESSGLMLGKIGSRLELLKNQLKELSTVIDGDVFKGLLAVANDALFGVLLAMNNEVAKTVISFKELGTAGKVAYTAFESIVLVGKTVHEVVSTIVKVFTPLVSAILPDAVSAVKALFVAISSYASGFFLTWLLKVIAQIGIFKVALGGIAAFFSAFKVLRFVDAVKYAILTVGGLITPWGLVQAAITATTGLVAILTMRISEAGRALKQTVSDAKNLPLEIRKTKLLEAEEAVKAIEDNGVLPQEIRQRVFGGKAVTPKQIKEYRDELRKQLGVGPGIPAGEFFPEGEEETKTGKAKFTTIGTNTPPPSSGTGGSGGKYKSRLKEEFELEKKHYEETIKIIKEKEEEKLNIVENYHALGETTDLAYYDEKYAIQKEAIDKEIEAVEKLKAAVMTGDVAKQFAKDMAALQSAESSGKDTTTLRLQLTDRYNNEQLEAFRRELDLKNKQKKIELDYYKNIKLEQRKLDKDSLDYKLALQEIEREKSYQIKKDEIDNLKSLNDYLFDHYERNGKEWVIESEKLAKQEKENRIAQLREIALAETQKLVQDRTVQNELETNRKIFEIDKKLHADIAKVESEELKNSEERHRTYAENIRAIYDEAGAGISGSFAVVKKVSRDLSKSYGDVANNVAEAVNGIVSGMHSAFTEFFSRTSEDFMDFGKLVEDILQKIADELLQLLIISPLMSVISGGMDTASNALMKAFMPTGRASGGYVTANTSYLVGERGMELFTPSSSGNITANNKLPGSNVNVIINNNTSAKTSVSETKDANGNLNLEVLIDEAVGKSITSQRGKTYSAIKQVLGGRSVLARR